MYTVIWGSSTPGLHPIFGIFCGIFAFNNSTYTCVLAVLDFELEQMFCHAFDTHTVSTHSWISSIFMMPTPSSKSKVYTVFLTFFVAFSHSTYTCVLVVLDSELAQMLCHTFDTHTLSNHSWISSIFMMPTPSSKSKVYTLFLTFFVAFSHSTYTCVLAVLDSELEQMFCHAFDTHAVSTHSWISSMFMMPTPFFKSKVYILFLTFFVAFSHSTIQRTRTLAYWPC